MAAFRVRHGHQPWEADRAQVCDEAGNHNGCLTVISDPDEDYGFQRGAEITRSEAQHMLLNRCFTPGTRLNLPGRGELTIVDYTYPVTRGRIVMIKTVQAMRGAGFYLLPSTQIGRCFERIGIHGQQRIRSDDCNQ